MFLWLGLILVVAGWLAGSNKYGTVVRTTVTGGLEDTGSQLAGGQTRAAGQWVAGNLPGLRTAVVVLGVVVLLWGNDVSLPRLWWSLALVLFLLALSQVLVGAGRGPGAIAPAPRAPSDRVR